MNIHELHPNDYIKYPRTPHLPFSEEISSDDKLISNEGLAFLNSGAELICTEKMDGGNLTMSQTHFHGRSIDSGTHAWDTQARALWASIRFDIPLGWRISGESMYARRSVSYNNLPGVYLVFGIWDDKNQLLSWDETTEFASLLDLPVVPVIYRGNSLKEAGAAWVAKHSPETSEGFVVRSANKVAYSDFGKRVGKYVRANHVRTRADWRYRDDFALNTFIKE